MKKICFLLISVLIIISVFMRIAFCLSAQEKDDTILEKVAVVNVEVPVRVVFKGKPVKDLKRSDFKIFEDGKLQNINAFFKVRKKINIQNYELSAEKREKTVYPSRYFVLIFNLIDYNRNLKEGLDYTFNNILKENDQLLVIVNDKNLYFNNLPKKEKILKQITKLLEEKGKISKNKLINLFNRINRIIREFKTYSAEGNRSKIIPDFINQYLMIWEIFKREYLRVDIDNFYYFTKHLEKIEKEKYVINFYQSAQFPLIKFTSISSNAMKNLIDKNISGIQKINLMIKTRSVTEFPSEEVSKLFYRVNATFHLILIPNRIDIPNQDLEFKEVSTALENCFREITKRTGGTVVSSTDLVTALDTISEKEDIYYMLTYQPENPEKVGKIRVEMLDNKHHYKVQYDKNIRADYIRDYLKKKKLENPEIKIKKIHFKDRNLYLEVKNFLLKRLKKEISGQVDLWVRVENSDGKILYDKHKKLNPSNETASIQVNFNWLKQGRYYFFVEASDELTGKSYPDYIQAEISETKTRLKRVEFKEDELVKPKKELAEDSIIKNKELEKYLHGAAEYCVKLKRSAFHFICREIVTIILREFDWKGDIIEQVRSCHFDYQLINYKNQINEQRLRVENKSTNEEKNSINNLVFSFLNERAVFGPDSLLSKERQNKFKYKIIKYRKQNNQQFVIINVIPKKAGKVFFSSGEVWIDTENYSVRRIIVVPRYIDGYEKLVQGANILKTRLFLNCEINFDQEYKGLFLPTKVSIIETYKGGPIIGRTVGIKGLERTRTIFTYKDYKFFNVNTDIQYE